MTRLMVTIGFVVAFLAGLIVGLNRFGQRHDPPGAASGQPWARHGEAPPDRGGFLASQLSLSPDQQKQMREIWSQAVGAGRGLMDERRRELRQQREEAIAALIRPEDKASYEAIVNDYARRSVEQDQQWRRAYDEAMQKTRQILTPQQLEKYEQLTQRWEQRDREHRRMGPRGGPSSRPANRMMPGHDAPDETSP